MTFREHLDELRKRLVVSILAIMVAMFIFLMAKDRIMSIVTAPYRDTWAKTAQNWYEDVFSHADLSKADDQVKRDYDFIKDHWEQIRSGDTDGPEFTGRNPENLLKNFNFPLPRHLISITPLQDMVTYMIAAMIAGIVLASPIVLHQLWAFIGAGLLDKEKRAVLAYLPFSILLFFAGCAFGYYVMVPYALLFLTGLTDPLVQTTLTIRDYFRFLFASTVALGFVFQLPVVMLGLVRLGICTPSLYLKYWRHAILTMFVLGAVLTPPDPITQLLMATPMLVLYGFGLLLSLITFSRMKAKGLVEPPIEGEE
jgi:Tat protein translocase TatC